MENFKYDEINEYVLDVKLPEYGISKSTNESLQNKSFNDWLGNETNKFLTWYTNEGFTGRTFYTHPDYVSSYSSRLRGKFVEAIMIRYLEKFSGYVNEKVGLADYYATTEEGPVIVEIKTQDYYDDNAGAIIPMTDFKGVDLNSVSKLYLLDVEFDKASDNNVKFAGLIDLSQTTVIENHTYQKLGIKKYNLHLRSGKNTLLVQTKSNKYLNAMGGRNWEVPNESFN